MIRAPFGAEAAIRDSIKTFGLKLGTVSGAAFEACVRELTAHDALIAGITDWVLRTRAARSRNICSGTSS